MHHNFVHKRGCITFATKSIDKTAAKLEYVLKKSTTIKVWSIKNILLIAILMIELMQLIQPTIAMAIQQQQPQQQKFSKELLSSPKPYSSLESLLRVIKASPKHHIPQIRKKHSVDQLEWENPCGGYYDENTSRGSISVSSRKAAFRALRKALKFNKAILDGPKAQLDEPNAIIIDDFKSWSIHNQTYKFLQVVKPQNNITLYRWHRNAQVYVASLAYFRMKQKGPDGKKSINYQSHLSKELTYLLRSSKDVLCFIEKAINDTHVHPKIHTISRNDMDHRLKFRTKIRKIEIIDEIDLKFLKVRYNEFMSGMIRSLNQRLREYKYCGDNNISAPNSASTSNSNSQSFESNLSYSSNNSESFNSIENKHNAFMCQKIRDRRAKQLAKKRNQQSNRLG